MSLISVLDDASRLLRGASRSIEDSFVGVGGRLESAIDILHRLSQAFSNVRLDLASDDLIAATRSMQEVAERISALTVNASTVPEALREITELTTAVSQRLQEMLKAVKAVDVLAVNAKIAAAGISTRSDEFMSFANEIGVALKVAGSNLADFRAELDGVTSTLLSATKSQASLRQYQTDAAATVPKALRLSVTTISDRNAEAGNTVAVIEQRTGEIARQVGIAVSALQIGDTTRQRIEHVEFAIDILRDVLNGGHKGTNGKSHGHFTAAGSIVETARNSLAHRTAQLQVAQLIDTAQELDLQSRRIQEVLTSLTRDAREMVGLARRAYGTGSPAEGTFLDELSDRVGQANELLSGLTTAQHDADGVVTSVMSATSSLTQHMRSIQSLESDIRLMGLNTTLKCSRLGTEGRSLTVIAQELRSCSNITASEAEAIMELLTHVAEIGGRLTAGENDGEIEEMRAIQEMMHGSIARMNGVGQALTTTLTTLSDDAEAVVTLLDEALATINTHNTLSADLTECSMQLQPLANLPAEPGAVTDDVLSDLHEVLSKSYTMARERDVHARFFPQAMPSGAMPGASSAGSGSSGGAPAEADLDDFLF
ncbi:MAG TPA: hypothetical protein VN229_00460 [Terriglobales bacterium]|nr:hypothetical protein [Terriglobales bacterium]